VTFTGPLAYAAVFLAAVIEGEVVFVTASVLVAAGKLDPLAVMTCGALGAAAGDQMFFYALRGRIAGWLTRSRAIAARRANIVARVQRHQLFMIFAIRFAPGLRIAITAACAYGNVSALRFTTLNLISAFAWAVVLMTLVSRVGPGALHYAGITGIWGAIVPAALLVLFAWWLGKELPGADSKVPASEDDGGHGPSIHTETRRHGNII
jgi:membrane protein DedA with SNARE-associated domain